jgi:hypothetical protein
VQRAGRSLFGCPKLIGENRNALLASDPDLGDFAYAAEVIEALELRAKTSNRDRIRHVLCVVQVQANQNLLARSITHDTVCWTIATAGVVCATTMAYEYDVFLSYLREKPCGTWVTEHFLPYFRHQLGNALAHSASIFLDRTEIHAARNGQCD